MSSPGERPADGRSALLKRLVGECIERMEREGEAALEALCGAHPELADALRRRISLLRTAGLLDAEPREPERIPERLGDFRLLRRLGAGGMGVVYLARQASLGRAVALKLLRPELLWFDASRTRFDREIESAAKLEHPGIVKIHAVGEEAGVPYFAMEHVEGCSLGEVLQALGERSAERLTGRDLERLLARRCGPPGDARHAEAAFGGTWTETCLRLVRQAAAALDHAHQRGVLHRDVKPSNLMVTADGRVVVLDFGLASIEGAGELTRTGSLPGSPHYMAPEQVSGDRGAVGRRTDVYGLGVTLYELLTLTAAFDGGSIERILARILEARPRPVRALNPEVPRDAETICMTAMHVDPRRRYASAGDLARDIDRFLALRPIEARRPGRLARARLWTRRHPAAALAGALGVVLVVGAPTVFAVQQSAARARVEEQRNIAEANFELAVESVDRMLTRVGEERLRHLPRLQPLRRELLEDALEFHRRFLATRADDPRVRERAARAYRRVAGIQQRLGRYREAGEALDRAVELYAELAERQPERTDLRAELAWCHNIEAGWRRRQGERDAAEARYREALRILEGLRERAPAALVERRYADVLGNLGLLLGELGRSDEALQHLERSVRLKEALLRRDPESAARMRSLAGQQLMLGFVLSQAGREEEARACSTEALAIYERLVERHPENPDYRDELAKTLHNLAVAQRATDRVAAVAAMRRCVELRRRLARDFPSVPDRHSTLAGSLHNLSQLLVLGDGLEEAERCLEEAIREQRRALAAAPGDADFRRLLRMHLASLCHLLLGLGRHREVPPRAAELAEVAPEDPQAAREAGYFVTRAIPFARAESGVAADERAALAASYGAAAVAHLREAVRRGFDDAGTLSGEDFAPLRARADFRRLLAELGGAGGNR